MRSRTIGLVLAAAAAVLFVLLWGMAGCSTADPVVAARAKAALGAVELVKAEAELGVRARQDAVCAERLGVAPIGATQAEFTRETIGWLEAHLRALEDRGLGRPAVTGTAGMPAGPTREAVDRAERGRGARGGGAR